MLNVLKQLRRTSLSIKHKQRSNLSPKHGNNGGTLPRLKQTEKRSQKMLRRKENPIKKTEKEIVGLSLDTIFTSENLLRVTLDKRLPKDKIEELLEKSKENKDDESNTK